ncbi:Aspartyl-tRNA synthetase [Giardia muris]|uniref:aspartate--tRNA ligase n=1 Tax=Giardia muris TaxID=5742 RepID=A0A4Z1SNU8_GIAMU|nr:Aspartyl-tRNA synthetase [Giardia muris]|eukprot:TNJ27482.1 Aspartyl-tRNA synthetase [Giardia muris]
MSEELSKKALKKAAREEKKAAQKAAMAAERAMAAPSSNYIPPVLSLDEYRTLPFGDAPLHMSQDEFCLLRNLTGIDKSLTHLVGQMLWVRARVHTARIGGKNAFLLLRGKMRLLQACYFVPRGGDEADVQRGKDLVKYIGSLSQETIVEVYGKLTAVETPIKTASKEHQSYELHIERVHAISRAAVPLPLQIEDASRPDSAYENAKEDEQYVRPGRDTRLDNRVLDLRTPTNQAIMRVRATVASEFRAFLDTNGFIEIQTPKLIPGASEGGAAVFNVKYFNRDACLAQSPQLYKQMCIAAGMQRVYEVGPVFRAENSHTHRHLCEFTGLDLEMEIHETYHEVLKLLGAMMRHIFTRVSERCATEIETIRHQFDLSCPAPLKWADETVIIDFREGIKLLRERGFEQASEDGDLTTELERELGRIVRERYETDFYILDKFPMSARPFYTMPSPKDPMFSNSYDMFIRGEEICSGAQRVHCPELLRQQCIAKGVNPDTLEDYIASFRYGCSPHGGAGLGLERIVMLLLGVEDCRQCCLFPRTPERLTP